MQKIFLCALLLLLLTITSLYPQEKNKNYRRTESRIINNEEILNLSPLPKGSGTGIWTELNPNVPRVDYIGIDFINPDTGWAVGKSGAIIGTLNGGENWTVFESGINNVLLKVSSYDGQVVIATGYDGIILRSSDSGFNWSQVNSGLGTSDDLWGVQMINDTLGWACGMYSSLIKTTNAGLTWVLVSPGLNEHYWSMEFLNEKLGFIVCGGGKVLKTIDGGEVWLQYQAGDTDALYTIDAIDSLHVVAGGNMGKAVYSFDGGITWNTSNQLGTDINCMAFADEEIGFAIGESAISYKTTNRGQTWAFLFFLNYGDWWMQYIDDSTGYSVGNDLGIYKTMNGYENWEKIFLNDDFSDVFFIDEKKGFIISSNLLSGKLYKTEDAGDNWNVVANAPGGSDLLFLDSLTGFIGGNYKTTDRGDNWYATNLTSGTNKVFFINDTTGWAISSSNIYNTTDGGETWQIQLAKSGISGIHFYNSQNGWAAVINSKPYKTTDGGENWIEQTHIELYSTRDVYFIDTLNGFFLESNDMHSTTDGGSTWILHPTVTGFGFGKFAYYDNTNFFVIGTSKVFRTNDGGENWDEFPEVSGKGLTNMGLVNAGLGYAVGEIGLILKYHDGSIPVELINFTAGQFGNKILIQWETATETNNSGFYIERNTPLPSGIPPLSGDERGVWSNIGFVEGKGTTTEFSYYSYEDTPKIPGKYYYRLKQFDFDGTSEYSNIIEIDFSGLPKVYNLSPNYPNPFNPMTTIKYDLPVTAEVRLKIYDILGREVVTLRNALQDAGRYEVQFDAAKNSSGVYFYKLNAGEFINIKKMILIK